MMMNPDNHFQSAFAVFTDLDFIYDIETYRNCFTAVIVHAATGMRWIFEVSDRMNMAADFIKFLETVRQVGARMFGYNNEGFDYPVIHHLLAVFRACGYFTAEDAYQKAQDIIATPWNDRNRNTIWADQRYVIQGDLLKIHHFDNFARATKLKMLEINMRSDFVVDLPYDPHTVLTVDQMDNLVIYNCHDVAQTLKFYNYSKKQIEFRDKLAVDYPDMGDVLNFNDTKIGKKFFEQKLEDHKPGTCYNYINGRRTTRQTHRSVMHLRDVISPRVAFQEPGFQQIINRLTSTSIVETKGVFDDMTTFVGGLEYVFGVGGIHASLERTSVHADDEFEIIDVDVASYYPNLAIANRFYPEHLSEDFCDIYSEVYNMRKSYDKKSAENAMLKLALNGVYGDSGNKYSPFFDLQYMMSITINGQLMLCMLAEWVMTIPGLTVLQANTDGITVRLPRGNREIFKTICTQWENHTGLTLEDVDYSAMHIRDVNNYLAVKTDGSVKRIGAYSYITPADDPFTRERQWHQNHSMFAVRKAAEARLVHGTPVNETLWANHDPFDFMLSIKVNRTDRLEHHWPDGRVDPVQGVSRYYVSTKGAPLVKVMAPLKRKPGIERPQNVQAGWHVKLVNDASLFDRSDLNFLYYAEEANKLTSWVT